ncbi:U3 small nucleolar RNA-associated protein 25-like [Cryptomeria japonica]|uniref:U3 small nucleolar RNA-associated protein 25-like n=1 Tax=Cryptomeria japonica TaxID=3369 RepID=UPI0027DA6D32|nr:U3 small nucleolar RNA-associated protein 25-like [Cryptomeria japonica]
MGEIFGGGEGGGGVEGREEGGGGDEGGGAEGGDEDIDIGGDIKSNISGDNDDSSRSLSSEDGDDDDDMPELEDVPTTKGGRGQVGERDDDDPQILKAWIQSLEEEVARRDVEQEAYRTDYDALEAERDHLQRERDEAVRLSQMIQDAYDQHFSPGTNARRQSDKLY